MRVSKASLPSPSCGVSEPEQGQLGALLGVDQQAAGLAVLLVAGCADLDGEFGGGNGEAGWSAGGAIAARRGFGARTRWRRPGRRHAAQGVGLR